MAIQNRRGPYEKFNKEKLLPGEYAIVLQNDPNCLDGKAAYICFKAGDVKRLATYEDMVENMADALEGLQLEFTEDVRSATQNANDKAAYAKSEGDYAKEQGDYAKAQGDYAKSEGNYAKNQGDYAKSQGDRANNVLNECIRQTGECKEATNKSIQQTEECREATKLAIDAATGYSLIYDPSDGNRETIQDTINHIWTEFMKALGSTLTAGEYDALSLTAEVYDTKKIAAGEYDTRAGAILT